MVRAEKYAQALSALQQIIIRARFLAAKENLASKAVGLLDAAEELPRLLADKEDRTDEFATALAAIAEKYPYCGNLFAEFSREPRGAVTELVDELQFV
ncbi:MAG: hypothetical protein HYR56_05225 [Acidobacteria bacterium]|nr:hypothetical protein [Acidobacteriota bacterium]MBI3426657.1 hypothetical protein [Acidobacteriota bacterium]